MALSLRNNSARGTVGLDIDDDYVAAVKADGSSIELAASKGLPEGLVRDGEVVDGPGLTSALKDFFKEHDLPRSVRLGVTNQQIVLRQIELPMIDDPKDRAAAVRFQAAEAIAMPLDEAVLDHHVVSTTPGEEGERAQVVVVAARETMIRQLTDVVRGAGLKPEAIDLDAFALVRMLASEGSSGENARIFVHLAGITNLAIAVGRMCLFTRPLATHWDYQAEAAAAAELSDEVRLSLDYYMAQPNARTVDEVVLSGPDAERPGIPEALESALGLPVKVAQPLGRLEQSDLPAGESPFRYTVAAGLALGAAA